MSPKQRKKPSRQKKQTSGSSETSPILRTNYREIHQTEVEALRSIYGDDFEEVENRRSAWQVGATSILFASMIIDLRVLAILRCDIQAPFTILLESRHTAYLISRTTRYVSKNNPQSLAGKSRWFSRWCAFQNTRYPSQQAKIFARQ